MTTWIYILLGVLFLSTVYLVNYLLNINNQIDKKMKFIIGQRKLSHKIESIRSQRQLSDLRFKEWLGQNEFEVRRTAIIRDNPMILESISNEIEVIKNNFAFNPKDIKFIGRFIDLIIFDGVADEQIVNIYFVTILTNSKRQPNLHKDKVRWLIDNKLVYFHEVNL
jgi:predicted Holliday junction resolvase-like endonuclease